MKVEFIQSSYDRYSGSSGGDERRGDRSLFWWTMLITVLLGLCCFSWFFSIYVFSHPEKPFNHRLLTKLKKLEPLKDFNGLNAPSSGGFLSPKEAYARFAPGRLGKTHLEVTNNLLKRNFVLNYEEEKPIYVAGQFRVEQIRPLGAGDPIRQGFVLRGPAIDYTALDFEYVIPTKDPIENSPFQIGDVVEISGPTHYASVVHVAHLPEERVSVSLIAIIYPNVGSEPVIAQMPPSVLNLAADWPLTDGARGSEVPVVETATAADGNKKASAPKEAIAATQPVG